MITIGEEVKAWEREYLEGDAVHRYMMHTILLMQKFKIERELEIFKKFPALEVSREEFEKALSH